MRYLYLSEKADAMKSVQAAYNKSDRFLGSIDFFALSGHVCRLLEPKEYKEWNKPWRELALPMVPEHFLIGIAKENYVSRLRQQLNSNHYDAIIVGTDSDTEGYGIYDYIEEFLHLQNYKALRFFEKDLTDKSIMESFHSLTDYHTNPRDVGITQAFRIRSRFDWLIGFNLSVAYSVRTGMTMKVGRVKAPTLKLVYDNCKEIENFQESLSYLPFIVTDSPQIAASYIDENGSDRPLRTVEEAKSVLEECGKQVIVRSIEKRTAKQKPAQLYKLSDIQVEAGQKFGYSPDSVLEALQNLYDKYKVLSYPRTDGRYVSSEKSKEFPLLLKPVMCIPGMAEIIRSLSQEDIDRVRNDKRYVNDEEVEKSSHDALLPTGKIPDFKNMEERERNICIMVYKRFLAIFLQPLAEEKSKIILDANGHMFIAKGSRVIDPGFTVIFDRSPKEAILPEVNKDDRLTIVQRNVHTVRSRPPKRLTSPLLLKAMENIQKYMKKGDLRDIMKKAHGIGMPSSRAAIIRDLIQSGYITEKKQGLYITDEGKRYVETLEGCSILNPELTAEWEMHLQNIREGSENYDEVYQKILNYLNNTLYELERMDIQPVPSNKPGEVLDICCPACGNPMRKMKWGYGCSGYPGCKFSIGEICGKLLTEKQVHDLIEKGKTNVINGFEGQKGKFNARLCLEGDKIKFDFQKKI